MKTTRVRGTRPSTMTFEPPAVIGKIRPGIKVLTKAAARNKKLVETYERGIAAEASFDDIEKVLKTVDGCPKYPLTPRETSYFRAIQGDFRIPGAAAAITDAYAEVRHGDPEPRLYSFPVFFRTRATDPRSPIDQVFDEYFVAYDSTGRLRWSEILEPGGDVMCMKYADLQKGGRRFHKRPTEAVEPCHPDTCPIFASKTCQHKGRLYFYVPVVRGTAPISLEFTSVYAKLNIGPVLEDVLDGLGRISGTYKGEPLFRVSKTREKVAYVDPETGKPSKVPHWIIGLSSPIDMFFLAVEQEKLPAPDQDMERLPSPERAVAEHEPEPEPEPEPAVAEPEPETEPKTSVADLRKQLNSIREQLNWSPESLVEACEDFGLKPDGLKRSRKTLVAMIERLAPVLDKELRDRQHAEEEVKERRTGTASEQAEPVGEPAEQAQEEPLVLDGIPPDQSEQVESPTEAQTANPDDLHNDVPF